MSKRNRIQLLSLTTIIIAEIFNPNLILASSLSNVATDKELIAKKSGGRSGGGSFKSRPSSSPKSTPSLSKPSPSYNQRPSTSSPTYRQEPSRTYRDYSPIPSYQNSPRPYNTYRPSHSSGSSEFQFLLLFLLIAGIIIYILYRLFSKTSAGVGSEKSKISKINRERDNDRITVSMLQVALSSAAENIQQELSELSLNADTDTESGLVRLMQESALTLLRHETAWTHVLSSSISSDINQAESAFGKLAIAERSKFSHETLSNMDGILKTKETKNTQEDDFADYVVVTLILGTADDQPLFGKINTEALLKEELLQLGSMRDDYLMKFELLWTPQQSNQYLTDEELLVEYSNIIPLV
jgi:uncharacterized membrane protein